MVVLVIVVSFWIFIFVCAIVFSCVSSFCRVFASVKFVFVLFFFVFVSVYVVLFIFFFVFLYVCFVCFNVCK